LHFIKKGINYGMNKNTVLGWATFIMIVMGLLIGLGALRDVSGWGLQPLVLDFWQTHGF
jgi:hypothetical protein